MSKLIRSSQKIFAGTITPTGNVAVYGSLAANIPAYSNDPDVIQSLAAWGNGWAGATVGNQSPAFQDFNGYQYVVTRQLAYLFQAGIPEWLASTIYYTGSWCQSAGVAYVSRTDNNTGNAVTDTGNWMPLKQFLSYATVATTGNYGDLAGLPSLAPVATSGAYADLTGKPTGQLAIGWVNFAGNGAVGNQVINRQFNISTVNKTATGRYLITFTSAAPSAYYAFSGSVGPANGGTIGPGDNNIIIGGNLGGTCIKTTTQFNISNIDQSNGNAEDGDSISVIIFGN